MAPPFLGAVSRIRGPPVCFYWLNMRFHQSENERTPRTGIRRVPGKFQFTHPQLSKGTRCFMENTSSSNQSQAEASEAPRESTSSFTGTQEPKEVAFRGIPLGYLCRSIDVRNVLHVSFETWQMWKSAGLITSPDLATESELVITDDIHSFVRSRPTLGERPSLTRKRELRKRKAKKP